MMNNIAIPRVYRATGFVVLSIALILTSSKPALAVQLSDLEWQNRPLLLFVPDHQDERLSQMLQRLQQINCDLNDRHMVIGIIVAHGTSTLAGQQISKRYASALRSHFSIAGNHFAMLLIGKDGGVKYRSDQVADLQQIFGLIDGMPMRQSEMQDNPVDCNSQAA